MACLILPTLLATTNTLYPIHNGNYIHNRRHLHNGCGRTFDTTPVYKAINVSRDKGTLSRISYNINFTPSGPRKSHDK